MSKLYGNKIRAPGICYPCHTMIRLERATREDIPALVQILEFCARQLDSSGLTYWNNAWPESRLNAMLAHKTVYRVLMGTTVVGTVTFSDVPHRYYDGREMHLWSDKNSLDAQYMTAFAIAPQFQGKGVGSKTLKLAESARSASGVRYVRLDINTSNPGLGRFYLKQGYLFRGTLSWGSLYEKRLIK